MKRYIRSSDSDSNHIESYMYDSERSFSIYKDSVSNKYYTYIHNYKLEDSSLQNLYKKIDNVMSTGKLTIEYHPSDIQIADDIRKEWKIHISPEQVGILAKLKGCITRDALNTPDKNLFYSYLTYAIQSPLCHRSVTEHDLEKVKDLIIRADSINTFAKLINSICKKKKEIRTQTAEIDER